MPVGFEIPLISHDRLVVEGGGRIEIDHYRGASDC